MEAFKYEAMFARRSAKCLFLVLVLMFSCILRVAVLTSGSYEQVRADQSSYRLNVCSLRGTIFDRNMVPITNSVKKTVAAVSPTPRAAVGVGSITTPELAEDVRKKLKERLPAVCTAHSVTDIDGISYATAYEHVTSNTPACHIVGYVDSSGHGVSGLEAAFDDILYTENGLDAVFDINGMGEALEGIQPRFEGDTSIIGDGVVTTLDVNIQSIAEASTEGIISGAAVVAEASSGKLRAIVSRPMFDLTDVSGSLDAENSPLVNRALAGFSVGSVFKPCVAAAALENGVSDFFYNCVGRTYIIDRYFRCHKKDGHGNINLLKALAFSCNAYFYNFAAHVGGDRLYSMANSLSFGSSIKLCEGIYTARGKLTDRDRLSNPASLANLSIGQGDLLLSPVSILTLYCAIAGDGSYYLPSLTEATLKCGTRAETKAALPTRVMSEQTAKTIREALSAVITEGTGTAAKPKLCSAAGKTATAQTGRYDEKGIEITNSWFCGFFPAEEPRYVVIVMSEGENPKSTAAAFADIADGVTQLEKSIK